MVNATRVGCGLLFGGALLFVLAQRAIEYASSTPARFALVVVVGLGAIAALVIGGVALYRREERRVASLTPAKLAAELDRSPQTVYPECPVCGGTDWRAVGHPTTRWNPPAPIRKTVHGRYLEQSTNYIIQRHACDECGFRGNLVAVEHKTDRRGRETTVLDIY